MVSHLPRHSHSNNKKRGSIRRADLTGVSQVLMWWTNVHGSCIRMRPRRCSHRWERSFALFAVRACGDTRLVSAAVKAVASVRKHKGLLQSHRSERDSDVKRDHFSEDLLVQQSTLQDPKAHPVVIDFPSAEGSSPEQKSGDSPLPGVQTAHRRGEQDHLFKKVKMRETTRTVKGEKSKLNCGLCAL